jgi:hypothetical protein
MELIVVAVLLQTLYFLAYDQHIFIVFFIGFSLLCQQYTRKKYYYLGIPIVVTHVIIYLLYSHFYKHDLEQFKGLNKASKKAGKSTKNGINKTGKKIKRTARKAYKGMKKAQKSIEKAVKENVRVVGTIQSNMKKVYNQAKKAAKDDNVGGTVKETPGLNTKKAEKADYDPKKDAPDV